ncbi:MAG TPA: mucoidy inhibitor MuiA family protein [Bacteroidales bacterium]|nr:mucoidy inhibitor MuiA family protein [Bacteroidales bacterium]
MKILISALVISLGSLTTFAQVEKEVKADIKHVTVFPDRAQVAHEAQVQLPAGTSTLRLSGLSPYIDPQSVQVKGAGTFTILSVNHQNNYLKNASANEEEESLRSKIEELKMKIEDENASIQVLKGKAEFLAANRGLLLKETTISPEQIRTIMDLFTTNSEQVIFNTLRKERLVKDYEKQLAALQQQLSSRTVANELPTGEISITAMADKPLTGKISYSYVVSNAGWFPTYDIRVDDIKNPVSISFKANVFQNTGQDWKNVMLSFSNATPWISGDVPVLYPWFLNFYTFSEPVLRNRAAAKGIVSESMAPSSVAVADEIRMEAMEEAAAPSVQKQSGQTTITYDIDVPYTISADNQRQAIEIQRLTADASYKYLTVPKRTNLAYLTANITRWSELSLQSGEATLYFENSYVGKSFINAEQVTDTMVMSLGVDNSILVKREKQKDFTNRRVLGSNRTETNSFKISVRNNKTVPVLITVKDQIPVSSNSSITVETVETSGGRMEKQTGMIEWDLNLKPAETKEIILTYSVRYPKDKNIILE